MKKESFLKKYKPEIIVGTGAIVSGILSFVITLNVYPKTHKAEKLASSIENEEYAVKVQDDASLVAQILNENKYEEKEIDEAKSNNEVEIKNDIGGGDAVVLIDEEEIKTSNEEIVTLENIETQDVIEAIAMKKEEEKIPEKKLDFDYPVSGDIMLEFAKDKLVYSETLNEWITHDGVDIKADGASPVKASEAGTVESVKMDPRYGNTIIIKHNDEYKTVYSNLSTLELVYVGKKVEKGDIISGVGDGFGFESKEGAHVHFEILKNGEPDQI